MVSFQLLFTNSIPALSINHLTELPPQRAEGNEFEKGGQVRTCTSLKSLKKQSDFFSAWEQPQPPSISLSVDWGRGEDFKYLKHGACVCETWLVFPLVPLAAWRFNGSSSRLHLYEGGAAQ